MYAGERPRRNRESRAKTTETISHPARRHSLFPIPLAAQWLVNRRENTQLLINGTYYHWQPSASIKISFQFNTQKWISFPNDRVEKIQMNILPWRVLLAALLFTIPFNVHDILFDANLSCITPAVWYFRVKENSGEFELFKFMNILHSWKRKWRIFIVMIHLYLYYFTSISYIFVKRSCWTSVLMKVLCINFATLIEYISNTK